MVGMGRNESSPTSQQTMKDEWMNEWYVNKKHILYNIFLSHIYLTIVVNYVLTIHMFLHT